MDNQAVRLWLEQARQQVEARLGTAFCGSGLEEAMRYSLLAGGKRIRPILTMAFCRAAGAPEETGLAFGCGVEMLHTYSLIHDDLPCMDNDDLRRGKPTCHKAFDECIATLAGDALQAAAFETVLTAVPAHPEVCAQAAAILARAAGVQGMCGGQYWDTIGDGQAHTLEELTAIHDKKTGALLRAACMMGVTVASAHGKVPEACLAAAREYATHLGLAFQIRDDILDRISTTEDLGKPVGSDAANEKTTYVSLLGVDACQEQVKVHTQQAHKALDAVVWPGGCEILHHLADQLADRDR